MGRPEPFRALLDEAYEAEGQKAPASLSAPVPFERRLDQILLAGVTPAHGLRVPASVRALRHEGPLTSPGAPPVDSGLQSASTKDLLDALDEPSAPRPKAHLKSPPSADLPAPAGPLNVSRASTPPPIPKRGAAPKTTVPAPVIVPQASPHTRAPDRPADRAPPPRITALLDDTHPSLRDSSSSGSGKIADLYRFQLEFEDTPARPLPRNASIAPLPVDEGPTAPTSIPSEISGLSAAQRRPLSDFSAAVGQYDVRDTPVQRLDTSHLEDEDGIADLDALARAMGLRGIGDVSIPSVEGDPIADDASLDDLPTLTTPPPGSDAERRARVLAALGEGKESVFSSDEGAPHPMRPALVPEVAGPPVIVKIPARPRVSAENRERARRLYLTAVDALAKADRKAAISHLRAAQEIDDGNPLYPELLRQLEKQIAQAQPPPLPKTRSGEGPGLLVTSRAGVMRRPQEHVRFRE